MTHMELLRGTVPTIVFEHPTNDTDVLSAVWTKGEDSGSIALTHTTGKSTGQLPYQSEDGEVKVDWTFSIPSSGTFTESTYHLVATPLLPLSEVKKIIEDTDVTNAIEAEAAARYIINAHTGQSFGKFTGVRKVRGTGNNALALPEKLLRLTKVNGSEPGMRFEVDPGGFYLRNYPWGVPPVRADYHGLHMHTGGVIHNPNNVKLGTFMNSQVFDIQGVWGWDYVPPAIQQAAKLLVNDYACADALYRDRYLTSMTAADWRIQFHAEAFANTGNVRADALLADYVLPRGWVVL